MPDPEHVHDHAHGHAHADFESFEGLIGYCLLMGILHASIPCAHSWPMLIPFAGKGARSIRSALIFGLGMVLVGTGLGAAVGLLVQELGRSASDSTFHRAEEIMGVILIALGLLFLVYPRAVHSRHVHEGEGAVDEVSCDHGSHAPRRLLKYGPGLGLFLLGGFNVVLPCATTAPVLGIAFTRGEATEGAILMAVFSLAAAITMGVILYLVGHGLHVLRRLDSSRFSEWVLRFSGLILIGFGLVQVFHLHEH